jgi:AcrR family transcriptional regulator
MVDDNLAAQPRTRGRPRAEGVEERVLDATREIVSTRGYNATTVEDIARLAGVSKGSVYRRWPTKGVLVYAACIASTDELPALIDTGDVRADLIAVATLTSRSYGDTHQQELVGQILADAHRDPELMARLRTQFFTPRADRIVERVERAIDRGELDARVNATLVPALVNGSQQYLWGLRGRALTDAEIVDLIDMIIGRE